MEDGRVLLWCAALCLAEMLCCQAAIAAAPDVPAEASGALRYVSYSGTAVARHSTKVLYREQHVLSFQGVRLMQRVVLYACPDGSAFARKTASYENPLAPDFVFEDVATGMRQGVRTLGTSRVVFYRANRVYAEKTGALPQVPGLVADTGFDEFIHANWAQLMSGKSLSLHFLVPSRLEELSFQVQYLRNDDIAGTAVEVFRLRLAGWLGWVLPGIDVSYDARSQVLMRYDGLSDLHDAAGDNFQTQIDFPAAERRATDGAADTAARQARLAPCH